MKVADARALLLDAQGLTADPSRPATPKAVLETITQLGFVQLDSIQRIERAHHLILGTRFDHYRPETLHHLAFEKRALFEHWTHDASLIPTALYPLWQPRFAKWAARMKKSKWFNDRLGKGAKAGRALDLVLKRIQEKGPARARDFDRQGHPKATGWWDWTPEKAALEFHWRTGTLAVAAREGFEKVYDLTERVLPGEHAMPTDDAHLDWAARSALERLGTATARELAWFWDAISVVEAARWVKAAAARGEVEEVSPKSFAFTGWQKRLKNTPPAPERLRLLAPFDPIVRDRKRLERLFGFAYQFEAFVPAPKRKWGYYVLPILEGDRFIGRIDPRFDRETDAIAIEGLWWEPGVKPTKARRSALDDALSRILARRRKSASRSE